MIKPLQSEKVLELEAIIAALGKSQAMIEFELDGTIVTANENFLQTMGYSLAEVKGKHHRLFVEPSYADSREYAAFWDRLRAGTYQAGEYKRFGMGGKEVWIQASYNPIMNEDGRPCKVIKFATDITAQKKTHANFLGQINAISKSQAVIEFNLDGTILTANDNFLAAMGYSLQEIVGKHHRLFVEPSYAGSHEYQTFWEKLSAGHYQAGEYKRIGKNGKEVWIHASYNPILDVNGKPCKVVKYASDITGQKLTNANYEGQINAISKSQAVIEFNLDGTVIVANDNFLTTLGYTLGEIQGRHHSMFVTDEAKKSENYRAFWESLRQGRYQAGEYQRVGKGGKDIWIQASYNPILNMDGKPYKVVKFATDITRQVSARMKVCTMLQTIASGSEELSASAKEIAESMNKSKNTADLASNKVEMADNATKKLNDVAKSMGGITRTISGITDQINLLALNATIESARAGEAGRGFAVVANEVKVLAGQAKKATDQISKEIENMRLVFSEVIGGLDQIKTSINGVTEYVTSTAAACEEQSAVVGEMSSTAQYAAMEARALG